MRADPIPGPFPDTPEWHDARQRCITASRAAAAVGLSEYTQPLQVYRQLVGEEEPFTGNRYTRRGTLLEPLLRAELEDLTGEELEVGLPLFYHGDYPFVGATPDARRKSDSGWLAEFKTCHPRRAASLGEEGTDDISTDWCVQAQVQMAVLNAHRTDVFVAVGFEDFRIYRVDRNDRLIDRLIASLAAFWKRVEDRTPPEIDFERDNAADLVRQIYGQPQAGLRTTLSQETVDLWVQYQTLGREISALTAERKSLKARVDNALGACMEGVFPSGKRGLIRKIVNVAASVHAAHQQVRIQEKDFN